MNTKCTILVGEADSFPCSALVLTNHELDLGFWIELFCETLGVRPRPRVALGQ
jgi:hypothetical protein